MKNNKLRCFFVEDPQSSYYDTALFQRIFQWLGTQGKNHKMSLKKTPRSLIMIRENVRTLQGARRILEILGQAVQPVAG